MSSINLEKGEPDAEESPSQRRRRARRDSESSGSSGGSGSSSGGNKARDKENTSVAGRLNTALTKLADQMAARGDDELADAIRDERSAMSQGLVSLTSSIPVLRVPLVILLSLLEPVLAFWRVGRILFMRFLFWRQGRMEEAQQQQAEWEAQQGAPGMPPVEVPQ